MRRARFGRFACLLVLSSSIGFAMPRVILWDVDGTLVDSTQLAWTSTNKVLMRCGYEAITLAQYEDGVRFATPQRMAYHATGDPQAEVGVHLARDFDEHYVQLVSTDTVPLYPGLYDLIMELKEQGVVQGALSNACGAYVRAVLKVHGFQDLFQVQLGADEVPKPKPAPDGLLKCCQLLGHKPFICLYISLVGVAEAVGSGPQ